jgi:hypothetical protein
VQGLRAAAVICPVGGLGLAGCGTLLPSSRVETDSQWVSHVDAVASLAALAPASATRLTVHEQGLDPARHAALAMLHFADLLQRIAAATLGRTLTLSRA